MTVNLPPKDLLAERGLLGSIFAADGACLDDVIPEATAEDFYLGTRGAHGSLYRACIQIHAAGEKVNGARAREVAAKFGPADSLTDDFMADLVTAEPHDGHAVYYARRIANAARSRALIALCTDAISACYRQGHEFDEVSGTLESKLHAIVEKRIRGGIATAADLALDFVASLDSDDEPGLETGFDNVDAKIVGLMPATLTILAARTSMGKTAFVQNIAMNVARRGHSVMFFSLEQDKRALTARFISSMTKIPLKVLHRPRNLTETQRDAVVAEGSRFAELPIFVDERRDQSVLTIAALARKQHRESDVKLVIVDYLQIIDPVDGRQPREQQVASFTRGLRQLAATLNVPIIALAQLNRNLEGRPDKAPRLSDLRESGAIEQDADVVMFLHRPEYFDVADRPGEAELNVAKNRATGETGLVSLCWHAESVTFRDAAHKSQMPNFSKDFQ